jgi:cyclopropane fatty-acyl-phospholipid synthase-like methyltransferase
MNYSEQFSKRADSYFSAMSKFPQAMMHEFKTAVENLELRGDETVVNIPAGCVNLESFLAKTINYKTFEIDKTFAKKVQQEVCSLTKIPCETESVDRLISIAALHHSTEQERKLFYQEVKRILKPNGLFVIADVEEGSKQDTWLNDFVNHYNSLGHKGIFWSKRDARFMEEAGFSVEYCVREYPWIFKNRQDMIEFSRELFYLDKANKEDIEAGLESILGATETTIPWKLAYFKCRLRP